MDEDKKEVERPQEWHSVTEVTPEMLDKEKTEPKSEEVWEDEGGAVAEEVAREDVQESDAAAMVPEPVEEPVAEEVVPELPDEVPTEEDSTARVAKIDVPTEWTVTEKSEVTERVFSSGGEQPFGGDEPEALGDEITEVEIAEEKDILKDEGEVIYASGGEQPFIAANAVIANVDPKIADALPDDDEKVSDSDKELNDFIVKSYKWILALLGMIIAVIIVYNAWLGPYQIKPNYAPETAPYERTPGEITRDSLDPMTHFPRKPEVIRKERNERMWNEMNVFERIWWWFFGDSPRNDY
jgi:hypothetical protein